MQRIELAEMGHSQSAPPKESRKYYAKLGCNLGCDLVSHALHPFARNTVYLKQEDNPLRTWRTSRTYITIILGSCQIASPFTIDHESFANICRAAEISPQILSKLRAKRPLWEYNIEPCQERTDKPRALELAISNYDIDGFLFVIRYDIDQTTLRGIAAFKTEDQLSIKPLTFERILTYLDTRRALIETHPLLLVPVLWEMLQFHNHAVVRWRATLYQAKFRLGVTRRKRVLSGYPGISYNFELLTAELASLSEELADTRTSASTIRYFANEYLKLITFCVGSNNTISREVDGIVSRSNLYLDQIKGYQSVLASLNSVLHHRSTQYDTQVAKSLAVIHLMFLPSTLVAAIVATGLFDLNASPAVSPSTSSDVSRHVGQSAFNYWHTFLAACLGITLITFAVWTLWCQFGQKWIDKCSKSSLDSRLRGLPHLNEELCLREGQRQASDLAEECLPPLEDMLDYSYWGGPPCMDGSCKH
jgi:hypothetical protein